MFHKWCYARSQPLIPSSKRVFPLSAPSPGAFMLSRPMGDRHPPPASPAAPSESLYLSHFRPFMSTSPSRTKKRPQRAEKHAPCSRYPLEIEHPVPRIKHPSPEMFAQCSPDVLSFTFCLFLSISPFYPLTLSHPTSSDCVLNIPFMNILFFPP